MRKAITTILLLIFLMPAGVDAQEQYLENLNGKPAEKSESEKKNDRSRNVNVDMQIVYGQYNNMLSTINLSQQHEDFVYLLSSNFKRSNDFGYKNETYENTSFYENKIGFTGNMNVSDTWKSILETEVNSDSHGMYNNTVFSREEKEMVNVSLKNVSKFSSSFEGYWTLGGAEYVHRLRPIVPQDYEKSRLMQFNSEFGGEYIWSPTNRIRFSSAYFHYDYGMEGVQNDRYLCSELVDDFYITRNFGLGLGANLDYNRDAPLLASPVLSMTVKDYKYATIVLLYRYDLVPFKPEKYYLQQKYIRPNYDLPPQKTHHGDMKAEFRIGNLFTIKTIFAVDKSENHYNYYTVNPGNLLSAGTLPVTHYYSKLDLSLFLLEKILEMNIVYDYSVFNAGKNVTYSPNHKLTSLLKYNGKKWKFEWTNRFVGQVYTDPESDAQIDSAIIGDFGVQRKMLESFYAYIRVENLYNNRYRLREGYPEPGITVLGGIRILI